MVREIKFKVYSKQGKYCATDDDFYSWKLESDGTLWERQRCPEDDWSVADPEDYVMCLYTGLKDKDGKEIYEGDILHYALLEQNYHIRWDIHNAKFCASGKSNKYDSNTYRASAFDQMVIIGNIYENPELLEE